MSDSTDIKEEVAIEIKQVVQKSKPDDREVRSFLVARDPSVDRRFRPCPTSQIRLFEGIDEECHEYADDEDEAAEEDDSDDATITSNEDDAVESIIANSASAYSHASSSNNSCVDESAQILLRMRPVQAHSHVYSTNRNAKNVLIVKPLSVDAKSNNKNQMEKHYTFHQIFDANVAQADIYQQIIENKINNEESFTVATYGTSGSGKTYTLLGNDSSPGIVQRALLNIFTFYHGNIYPTPDVKLKQGHVEILSDELWQKEEVRNQHIINACTSSSSLFDLNAIQERIDAEHSFATKKVSGVSVFIWLSFVELYNELVFDLLTTHGNNSSVNMIAPAARDNLRILTNKGKVFVKGLTSVHVKNSTDALKLLQQGLQRVNYASTAINKKSSRSHIILFVDILKYELSGVTQISYKFCDLAGSERLDKTGNIGSRLKEAQRINLSLMVLSRCIGGANKNNTTVKNEVVPYRESKLTMLLQAALLGKEKLILIVNITPNEKFYEENLHVLSFAAEAKNLICKQPQPANKSVRYSLINSQTSNINEKLIQRNMLLHSEKEKLQSELVEQQRQHILELEELKNQHKIELEIQEQNLRRKLVETFNQRLQDDKLHYEEREQTKLTNLQRQYEKKIEEMLETFEEEKAMLFEQKENEDCPNKKRRTTLQ